MSDHRIERPPYGVAPDADTLGLRHVRVALADLEWPQSTRALRARAGSWRVPITGAHAHPLADLLEGVPERAFGSPRAVAVAIGRAHPELRR
jgi:hypothetical protein